MATAEIEVLVPVRLAARPTSLRNVDVMVPGTTNAPAPVLVVVAVVRNKTNDSHVSWAAVGEVRVPVVDPARPVSLGLGTTPLVKQGLEKTVLASIVVHRLQTTEDLVATVRPVHVSIPAVDPVGVPVVTGDLHGSGLVLVRPL